MQVVLPCPLSPATMMLTNTSLCVRLTCATSSTLKRLGRFVAGSPVGACTARPLHASHRARWEPEQLLVPAASPTCGRGLEALALLAARRRALLPCRSMAGFSYAKSTTLSCGARAASSSSCSMSASKPPQQPALQWRPMAARGRLHHAACRAVSQTDKPCEPQHCCLAHLCWVSRVQCSRWRIFAACLGHPPPHCASGRPHGEGLSYAGLTGPGCVLAKPQLQLLCQLGGLRPLSTLLTPQACRAPSAGAGGSHHHASAGLSRSGHQQVRRCLPDDVAQAQMQCARCMRGTGRHCWLQQRPPLAARGLHSARLQHRGSYLLCKALTLLCM